MTSFFSPPSSGTSFANVRRAENGYRVGQDHQSAKLTDDQVRAMRRIYAERKPKQRDFGYGALARMFNCSVSTARDIVLGKTRVL